jgi:hypothetical protein
MSKWKTALDLDFAQQSNQTLGSDGNYLINGLLWTKSNSVNDASPMQIVTGQGLIVQPVSTTYNQTTAPTIWLPLSQLSIPELEFSDSFRIWYYVSNQNAAAGYDQYGVYLSPAVPSSVWTWLVQGILSSGTGMDIHCYNTIQQSISQTLINLNLSSNVSVLEVPSIYGPYAFGYYGAFDTSSNNWPESKDLYPLEAGFAAEYVTNGSALSVKVGDFGIALNAARNGSATALSVTFGRIKIEYRD